MEPLKWPTSSNVAQHLLNNPYDFDFHQIVFIYEALNPEAVPLGEGTNPALEPLKIVSRVHLSVSSGEIQSVTLGPDHKPTVMVNFLGIAGIQGALPTAYTEILLERIRKKDYAFRDFLDIFNHRLVSVLHKIRKRNVVGLWKAAPQNVPVGKTLKDLSGLGLNAWQDLYRLPDRAMLGYAPIFWMKPRSAIGLDCLIKGIFKIPAQTQQWKGGWTTAPKELRTSLGNTPQTNSFNILGRDAILGARVWNQAKGITIKLGPISWEHYKRFRPFEPSFGQLQDLVRFYVGSLMRIALEFYVKKETIEPVILGNESYLGYGNCLGPTIKQDITIIHHLES